MFTIHTARPGEAYHTLHPRQRLGYAVPGHGFDFELEVQVRVDYSNPGGNFIFKFWLNDSAIGDRPEVITISELMRRRQVAHENGEEHGSTGIHAVSETGALWLYCAKIERHFRAMMALDLFALPVN